MGTGGGIYIGSGANLELYGGTMIVKSCYVAGGAVGFEENWDAKQKDLEAFYPKLVGKILISYHTYIYIYMVNLPAYAMKINQI